MGNENKTINTVAFTESEKKFLAVFITWFADYDMYAYTAVQNVYTKGSNA